MYVCALGHRSQAMPYRELPAFWERCCVSEIRRVLVVSGPGAHVNASLTLMLWCIS